MIIEFLNVDLEIESPDDLRLLIVELEKNCSLHIHDKKENSNNFAVFSHHSSYINGEINEILALFCDSIEDLSQKAREIWNTCQSKKFDAGFESGNSPKDFQTEIRTDILKRITELGASIAITIYPIND